MNKNTLNALYGKLNMTNELRQDLETLRNVINKLAYNDLTVIQKEAMLHRTNTIISKWDKLFNTDNYKEIFPEPDNVKWDFNSSYGNAVEAMRIDDCK